MAPAAASKPSFFLAPDDGAHVVGGDVAHALAADGGLDGLLEVAV
jgi:hypothetical protein